MYMTTPPCNSFQFSSSSLNAKNRPSIRIYPKISTLMDSLMALSYVGGTKRQTDYYNPSHALCSNDQVHLVVRRV